MSYNNFMITQKEIIVIKKKQFQNNSETVSLDFFI
jgi:hypothetical protein